MVYNTEHSKEFIDAKINSIIRTIEDYELSLNKGCRALIQLPEYSGYNFYKISFKAPDIVIFDSLKSLLGEIQIITTLYSLNLCLYQIKSKETPKIEISILE